MLFTLGRGGGHRNMVAVERLGHLCRLLCGETDTLEQEDDAGKGWGALKAPLAARPWQNL